MADTFDRIVRSQAAWRALVPFAALCVLLIVFAVGGMVVVAREADRSDAARAREAVDRTFHAMLAHIDAAVEMNAAAPPITDALSGAEATPASSYGYLNFTSSEALGYHGTLVLEPDGTPFAGTRFGLPWTGPSLDEATRLVAPVAAKLPVAGVATRHAVVRDRGSALAVSVTNVVPGPRATAAERAAPQRRLAMIVPVAAQLVPKILPSLGVEDFRTVAAGDGRNDLVVPIDGDAPLVFAWRPRAPGRAAIARWAPAVGALLLAALLLLAAAARANIAAMRALEWQAYHDALTGLANRFGFRRELGRREARGETIALGMIDLNDFKAVNDRYGHQVGDGLLQGVAAALRESADADDYVARLGGDEFAWLSRSAAAADRLAAVFNERIAQPIAVGSLRLRTAAAIGFAQTMPGVTASALMAMADARLYADKDEARRRVHRR